MIILFVKINFEVEKSICVNEIIKILDWGEVKWLVSEIFKVWVVCSIGVF